MRAFGLGWIVFAASMALAGVLRILFHDFAPEFGEVPRAIAARRQLTPRLQTDQAMAS